ncbi:spermidine/putrescine ABC transporter substrate-binding protein [Myxococcota bacterium]|nr:spermidine/putrescine ABC transporter substrate-binding protein [Myxococcota bacterium]
MSNEKQLRNAFLDYATGRMGRRDFIRGALAMGASVTAVATMLQACGDSAPPPAAETPPPPPGPMPATAPAAPPEPELGEKEGELHIYNWSDYIAEDTVANFEKESGIKVVYDTYESNEEMVAKLQVGAGGYDIVVPTGYIVTVLAAMDLLQPLSKGRYIPNWGNVAGLFKDPVFDKGNLFGVPWQWGTTGIAWRKDKVPTPPDSWGVFLDPALKNKMTMMDDMRDVIGAWLRYRGKSLNSTVDAELQAAKADAIAAKGNLKAFISAPVKGQLVSGDVWIAQLWNGDTMQAKAEQAEIEYLVPKEGSTIWTDSLVIPKSAPHKRAAHEFMNYILRPEVAASISNFTGYGTPVEPAMAMLAQPVPYPSGEELSRLEYQGDLARATELWDQIWTEIKAS